MAAKAITCIPLESTSKSEIIGSSGEFRYVWNLVQMVAGTGSAVLIHGETGTGKELVAKAIHEQSLRRRGPYVRVNCAAIPAGLLESELFGHERGAFTGALTQTCGRFQLADTGTLFIDEIGDLPLELQPKLLRVLQEQEFERLGSTRTTRVDVRIVAATNQDLPHMVRERRFRADLFYRLNVFPIDLPPLRERRDDVPLLVEHFVEVFARQQGKIIDTIPEEVMMALARHDWPGNVRELQNVVERGVVMTTGRVLSWHTPTCLEPADLQAHCVSSISDQPVLKTARIRTLADAGRAHIIAVLRETNWRVGGPCGAAAQLGVPRTTLIGKMRQLGISKLSNRSVASTQGLAQPPQGLSMVANRSFGESQ
jgi:formate hydrogenlyase transcriptional activator